MVWLGRASSCLVVSLLLVLCLCLLLWRLLWSWLVSESSVRAWFLLAVLSSLYVLSVFSSMASSLVFVVCPRLLFF